MPDRPHLPPVDHAALAEQLAVLGYVTRLELLEMLRLPHAVSDIELIPQRGGGPGEPSSASRSTVYEHLRKLEEVGLVRAREVDRGGRPVKMFMADSLRLYALLEDLRRVVAFHAGHAPAGDATGTLRGTPAPRRASGPRLVLVHGLYEGRSYPLDPTSLVAGRWTIGRKSDLPVSLDYDPYASLENAYVEPRGGRFVLHDFADSKNGTSVNWEPLPRGGVAPLHAGDVVGVGRSLLCFVPE
jgi:DNA-binding transcriptional ArsR family regulator